MESIKDKVAIVGMGCTKFGENWDKSIDDMIIDAAYEAYADAGIGPDDIQAAWWGTVWSGETAQIMAAPLKLPYLPITRIENACATGLEACRSASYAVASGVVDVALVVCAEKLKDTGFTGLPQTRPIATWSYRLVTQTPPAIAGMNAISYFAKSGLSIEEGTRLLAQIAVKNHHNGTLNPRAHFQREITVEQALNAPMIAYPLRLFDCSGVSDGAAAAIVTRVDMAKKFRGDPIYIKALQTCQGPREGWMHPSYDFAHVEETRRCSTAAYAEAGIKKPSEELSIVELHDAFTILELSDTVDLHLYSEDQVREGIENGWFTIEGKLPINTDGGLKCLGHPIAATGMRMLHEVYTQLQGKAGKRQIKNPRLGLVHNQGGEAGAATVSVLIAGNELN